MLNSHFVGCQQLPAFEYFLFSACVKQLVLRIYLLKFCNLLGSNIGLMSRVLANDPGNQGSITGRVISKTKKKNGT